MKFFIVLFSIFSIAYCQQTTYRLCLDKTESYKYCDELNRGNTVQCIKATDSVECTKKLANGEADFAILYPEQAHLASGFVNEQTTVVAEVRAQVQELFDHKFQMVAVVRKTHSGGLEGLRNKKYCHPGFSGHELWSPRVLKEFEYILLGDKLRRNCNNRENLTYVEQEFAALNEFFGDSCRSGPWSDDVDLDNKLLTKYPKLTKLCNEHSKKDSLACMKMETADVAYTSLSEALKLSNKEEFRLLCKNGNLININRTLPAACSWRNQPWTLIVASRGQNGIRAQEIWNNLKYWIKLDYQAVTTGAEPFATRGANKEPWTEILAKILLQDTNQYRINILRDTPLLLDFFKRNNQQLDSLIESECPMRWCTVSEREEEKCNWLARASLYAGIEPQVSCIAGQHIYDCLQKIRGNNADVLAIDSNYGYLARKMGLQNLLYSENSEKDIASIIAVIKEESSITTLKDLKNKNACFPEYRGLAWVSFIDSAINAKVMKNNCEFGKSISEYFSGICAPGAKDIHHYRRDNETYDRLCSLCSDNCQSDISNRYFNNSGALSCLAENKADVAFVEWQAIEKEPNLNNYRVLCPNNRILTIDEYRQDIESCSLSNTVDSEVIARHNDTRRQDYKLSLLSMDTQFGTSYKIEQTFRMFKEFNREKNLLFKDNVLGLDDKQSENKYVQNYVKLFERVEKCTSSSSIINISITLFVASLFVVLTRQM